MLERVLPRIAADPEAEPVEIVHYPEYTHDLLEVVLDGTGPSNGGRPSGGETARRLILKRGLHDWSDFRFRSARLASALLHDATDLVAPAYLDLPASVEGDPVLGYWKIPLPTLEEVWDSLGPERRRRALESWGRALRSIHRVRVDGGGPLDRVSREGIELRAFLVSDVADRLLPAVRGTWPAGEPLVGRLASAASRAAERAPEESVLLHADFHFSNVLYDPEDGRCVGLLDLEASMAGLPEADLAYLQVVHSDLLAGAPEAAWWPRFVAGYGDEGDPWMLAFFRAWHLLNIAFYEALEGAHAYADELGEAAAEALDEL